MAPAASAGSTIVKQLEMVQGCPVDKDGKLLKEWSDTIKAWEELESESPQFLLLITRSGTKRPVAARLVGR